MDFCQKKKRKRIIKNTFFSTNSCPPSTSTAFLNCSLLKRTSLNGLCDDVDDVELARDDGVDIDDDEWFTALSLVTLLFDGVWVEFDALLSLKCIDVFVCCVECDTVLLSVSMAECCTIITGSICIVGCSTSLMTVSTCSTTAGARLDKEGDTSGVDDDVARDDVCRCLLLGELISLLCQVK